MTSVPLKPVPQLGVSSHCRDGEEMLLVGPAAPAACPQLTHTARAYP